MHTKVNKKSATVLKLPPTFIFEGIVNRGIRGEHRQQQPSR